MKVYSTAELKERFRNLGFRWFDFHLIGIRSKADKPNAFDDMFYLINGATNYQYTGTTNPGVYWLKNPMNVEGAAVMKADQQCVDCWALGLHKGESKAWVQVAPVTVIRDNNRDEKSEENGCIDTGLFGINIHRANAKFESVRIDKWSAGCQVFNNPIQHKQFILFSEESGLKRFTYTLLKEF